MAPQEVAGLQALAKAHGGTLTVNPDTGLPEAGILSNLLPMVIGAGLSVASGGTLTPLMAAGITGAGYGVATGSLQKGLMAGLGAYGGAGLAGGLMGAGAAAGLPGTGLTAAGGVAGANPMVAQPMTFGAGPEATSFFGSGASSANSIPSAYAMNPEAFATNAYKASPIHAELAVKNAVPTITQAPSPISDRFSQAFQGAKNLGTEEGLSAFMSKEGVGGGSGLLKYGLAGLSPMLLQEPERMAERPKDKPYEYTFDYGRAADPQEGYTGAYTGERTYFNPVYTRTAAGGGLMDIGPVEAMSNQNQADTMMANGGMRFAEGGDTAKAVRPVEENPYYTMTGQSGDAFKYLMGQGAKPAAPVPAATAPVQSAVSAVPATAEPKGFLSRASSAILGQTQTDGQGGRWEDAPGNIKPYTFDPNTGTFTAAPAPKVWVPYATPVPGNASDYGYGDYGVGASAGASGGGSDGSAGAAVSGEPGWAQGGIASLAQGGKADLPDGAFVVPARITSEVGNGSTNAGAQKLSAMERRLLGGAGRAVDLGRYSGGGNLVRGGGDGVSDSVPATIGGKRPARIADGEYIFPPEAVKKLGNGSTEAGARKLYAMMDRVQKARGKTTGKNRVAVNSRAEKLLPA
jgi:hypothetical protein